MKVKVYIIFTNKILIEFKSHKSSHILQPNGKGLAVQVNDGDLGNVNKMYCGEINANDYFDTSNDAVWVFKANKPTKREFTKEVNHV